MLIKVAHCEYVEVSLVQKNLTVRHRNGERRELQGNIEDIQVSVVRNILHIVAFCHPDFAWHYFGEKALARERLDLGHTYGGGSQLLADKSGQLHLFYFTKQSPGFAVLLRHRIFDGGWSNPILVTTNALDEDYCLSVSGHYDNYLHAVYCRYRDEHLFYRVFDLKHRVWSGAVSLVERPVRFPQLIPGDRLCLFWQEGEEIITLRAKEKRDTWQESRLICAGLDPFCGIGYAPGREWYVFWSQENALFSAAFGQWERPQPLEKGEYVLERVAVEIDSVGALTLPVYRPSGVSSADIIVHKQSELPENGAAFTVEKAKAEDKKEKGKEERMAESGQTLAKISQEWVQYQQKLEAWQKRFLTSLPEPSSLAPLAGRLDRLERRFALLKQRQKEEEKARETGQGQQERQLFELRRRLGVLEEGQRKRRTGLWNRVIGKR